MPNIIPSMIPSIIEIISSSIIYKKDLNTYNYWYDMAEEEDFNEKDLEPEDYYFNEEGFMVFTEKYHLKRGYCCESNCKHCPYGFNLE